MGELIIMAVFLMGALLLIILLMIRKDIKDIQESVNYIYNNQSKVSYIYKVVKEVRKEREKKTT
tara:strand:+ start:84 stop:275 length:192 start_codon:yes stop_codon:yes gene_type:complete